MYWRIRKFTPEMIVKAYGIYAVAAVSIVINVFMLSKAAPSKGLTAQQKNDFTTFARQVTTHLTDSNFLTYEQSMTALVFNKKAELAAGALKVLSSEEVVPGNVTQMRALARQYKDKKSVACISIDSLSVGDPDPGHNMWVPCDVSGRLVQHSAEGVLGPQFFRFQYYLAMVNSREDPTLTWPSIVEFKDKSNEGPPPIPTGGP